MTSAVQQPSADLSAVAFMVGTYSKASLKIYSAIFSSGSWLVQFSYGRRSSQPWPSWSEQTQHPIWRSSQSNSTPAGDDCCSVIDNLRVFRSRHVYTRQLSLLVTPSIIDLRLIAYTMIFDLLRLISFVQNIIWITATASVCLSLSRYISSSLILVYLTTYILLLSHIGLSHSRVQFGHWQRTSQTWLEVQPFTFTRIFFFW